jgi:hypothetical protein
MVRIAIDLTPGEYSRIVRIKKEAKSPSWKALFIGVLETAKGYRSDEQLQEELKERQYKNR